MTLLVLDGSRGEGGGQMLRTALVWSLWTGTPFRMVNIRAGRRNPGLKAQHVTILEALRRLGPVSVKGAAVGSGVVEFLPAPLKGAEGTIDIGTAGSITLLLQTVLPAALRAEGSSRLRLVGGTDVAWSPPLDYFREVILAPARERAKTLRIHEGARRGFYPKGGGEVTLEAEGWTSDAPPVQATERGDLLTLRILSVAAESLAERRVAERQLEGARPELVRISRGCRGEARYSPSFSAGSVVTCVAEFGGGATLGASALGERGKAAEEVGREAADALVREVQSGACVDSYAADQMILWMALRGGGIRTSEVTRHTLTNIEVTEAFTGKLFTIEGTTIRSKGKS